MTINRRSVRVACWVAAFGLAITSRAPAAFGQGVIHKDPSGCVVQVTDGEDALGGRIYDPEGGAISYETLSNRLLIALGGDFWDHIVVYPNFTPGTGDTPEIRRVFNNTDGLGISTTLNIRSTYGASSKLEFVAKLPNLTTVPSDLNTPFAGPHSALSQLAWQIGRRWSASLPTAGLVGVMGENWSFFLNSPSTRDATRSSSAGGNAWTSAAPFSSMGLVGGYSHLDQYLMGLRGPEAVQPTFFIAGPTGTTRTAVNLAASVAGVMGTATPVTLPTRIPAPNASPKVFQQVFVLLAQDPSNPGAVPIDGTQVTQLEGIRAAWTDYFREETSLLGQVDTCLNVNESADVMFLLDLSGSFAGDLANFKAAVGNAAAGLIHDVLAVRPNSRFGLASFVDFPIAPFGSPFSGDYTYKVDVPLTSDVATFVSQLNQPSIRTYSGGDSPQNQYEALYQLLTRNGSAVAPFDVDPAFPTGLDLNDNGTFEAQVDVDPATTNFGRDPSRPLLVFLFTDADFHDPNSNPNYPAAGVSNTQAHGRAEVLALMQTLFASRAAGLSLAAEAPAPGRGVAVFGMLSAKDFTDPPEYADSTQLRELAATSGGDVFQIGTDSETFAAKLQEALNTLDVPNVKSFRSLSQLAVRRATLHWNHDHDDDKDRHRDDNRKRCRSNHLTAAGAKESKSTGHGGHHSHKPCPDESLLEMEGRLVLAGANFADLARKVSIAATLGSVTLVTDAADVRERKRGSRTIWSFESEDDKGIRDLEITWTSPTEATYSFKAAFDAKAVGVDGRFPRHNLTLLLSLGSVEPASREAVVTDPSWRELNKEHWRTGTIRTTTFVAEQVAPVLLKVGAEPGEADRAGGCSMGPRTTSSGGQGWPGALALGTAVVAIVWRRRRRRP